MPIQCRVTRNNLTESIHVIYAVVVDSNGEPVYISGDPHYLTCIRSALKPFQAATAVTHGAVDAAGFSPEELALMCASHNGEDVHVKTAISMIQKLGLDEHHLECGFHPPYHRESRFHLIREENTPTPFHNNCSGKHAGMLSLAKKLGVTSRGYTKRDHPVQEAIFNLISNYTHLEEIPYAVDGCSAPTPFFSLLTIANLFRDLANRDDALMDRIYSTMTAHPYLLAGVKRFDTDFNQEMRGRAVTKIGGEAIRGVGIRTRGGSSFGVALKVLDGNTRPLSMATVHLLRKLDLLEDAEWDRLSQYHSVELLNHRQIHYGNVEIYID